MVDVHQELRYPLLRSQEPTAEVLVKKDGQFFPEDFVNFGDEPMVERVRRRKPGRSPLAAESYQDDILSRRAGEGRSGKRDPSRVRPGSRKDRRIRSRIRGLTGSF